MACSGLALPVAAGGGAGAAATPPVAQTGAVAAGSWPGDPQPASVMANAIENPRRRMPSAPLRSCMLAALSGDHDLHGTLRRQCFVSHAQPPTFVAEAGRVSRPFRIDVPTIFSCSVHQTSEISLEALADHGASRPQATPLLLEGRLDSRVFTASHGQRVLARCGSNRLCFPTGRKGDDRGKAAAGPVA